MERQLYQLFSSPKYFYLAVVSILKTSSPPRPSVIMDVFDDRLTVVFGSRHVRRGKTALEMRTRCEVTPQEEVTGWRDINSVERLYEEYEEARAS